MTNKTILKRIASTPSPFRAKLARDCKAHSEAQCNGDYYFDDERQKWVGYNRGAGTHHEGDFQAIKGEKREQNIIKRILEMTGTKTIPDFLVYTDDVRGFVIKIHSDKLTQEEIEYCRMDCDFMQDWGSDFAIIKDSESNLI